VYFGLAVLVVLTLSTPAGAQLVSVGWSPSQFLTIDAISGRTRTGSSLPKPLVVGTVLNATSNPASGNLYYLSGTGSLVELITVSSSGEVLARTAQSAGEYLFLRFDRITHRVLVGRVAPTPPSVDVYAVDPETGIEQHIAVIPIPPEPSSGRLAVHAFDAMGRRLFFSYRGDRDLSVVDVETGSVHEIDIGGSENLDRFLVFLEYDESTGRLVGPHLTEMPLLSIDPASGHVETLMSLSGVSGHLVTMGVSAFDSSTSTLYYATAIEQDGSYETRFVTVDLRSRTARRADDTSQNVTFIQFIGQGAYAIPVAGAFGSLLLLFGLLAVALKMTWIGTTVR
jgi:hypothetical protein